MTKVLFLLSAIVMVVAIAFSYLNRQSFVQAREARFNSDKQINAERKTADSVASEVAALKQGVVAMNTEVSNEGERLNQADIKVKNATSEGERTNTEYKNTLAEIEKIKDETAKLPPGVTIETINEDIAKLKLPDLNCDTIESAMRSVRGTARSMGLDVID